MSQYKQMFRKWFSLAAPVNAVKANATLTFTSGVTAGEVVTIGNEVYEFVAVAGDIDSPTNIPVVLGVTLTADNAITKIAEAISANSAIVDAVGNTTADTVLVVNNLVGTEGNEVAVSTDCVAASWGEDVTNLSGGRYATPAMTSCFIIIDGVWYIASNPVSKWDTTGWKSATPS